MPKKLLPFVVVSLISASVALGQSIGERPYEMEWADRHEDTRPPTLDFERLDGWAVECQDAKASFEQSREQQIWGQYVGKLVYRGTGPNPVVSVRPPKPIPIRAPFDCVNLWAYGNNWAWAPDRTTPQVEIRVLLQSATGSTVPVVMSRVRWKEWWLMHRRLTAEQQATLGDRPVIAGLEIRGGRNESDRTLYFDNLTVYKEPLAPLKFTPRRKRGIDLPPGQTVGNNVGPGRLPFPTRDETILPDNLASDYHVKVQSANHQYVLRYRGDDGELVYRYKPETGTLSDLSAEWAGRGGSFRPLVDGGVYFETEEGKIAARESFQLVGCTQEGDQVVSRWRCSSGKRSSELTYRFRIWQKSLVIDIACPGGQVGEFRIGKVVGVDNPRLVTLPYLTGAEQRPAVLVSGPVDQPLFTFALVDHCRSNASLLWFANQIADDGVIQNGGSRYLTKTDGTRNPCFERLFLTVSPRFEEILPNIPNPKSPWMHVAGERVWRAHGASDRASDYAHWKKVARYGMTKVVITDHETGWRDGGESFTLRTRAAPGKGGDPGQAEYARKIRALGIRYGIYNNYTDYAPVNEHWDEDYVTRTPDNQWRTAWARCYNPKPARAVELEARLAPIIQQKFHLDTAYCDVHTAVRPWSYCDFDARVPGAGTFAATFYAYGEIMLHQKATWNGPVYSEGNNHWYYCGLTDGNYGQDQVAHLDRNPWLVDFDLRKLHPQCCNFGMGNPGMFFGRHRPSNQTAEDRQARLDRFLAATLAFGHTGFLVFEGGFENAVQSYYDLQQVHAAYAQQTVSDIRYADGHGRLLDTSQAVASGVYRRSQIATRYQNGLQVLVNGHTSETWKTEYADLPPNGWYAQSKEGRLLAFSALVGGQRADYVDSPAYIYANGRGRLTRFPKATCDGQLVVLRRADGSMELIPVGKTSVLGVSLDGRNAQAVALNEAGERMKAIDTRYSRGLVYVSAVPGATSYFLTPSTAPTTPLQCERIRVVPGETVQLKGPQAGSLRIPVDARPGQIWWHRAGQRWIDFSVAALVTAAARVEGQMVAVDLLPQVARKTQAKIEFDGTTRLMDFAPGEHVTVVSQRPISPRENVRQLSLHITCAGMSHDQSWWLKTEDRIADIAALPAQFTAGQRLRGKPESPLGGTSRAAASWTERACGNEAKKCLFMHPPYVGGVGYTFARFDSLQLPSALTAAFRCTVGKADGSDPGDGILFRVAVVDASGAETVVAERQWIRHAWTPLEADLSRWHGQRIGLKLIADVGPADNSSGDWGCWADLRIESLDHVPITTLDDHRVALARQAGPFGSTGLGRADLREASKGFLHFQGIGLQNGGQYVTRAELNGVAIGDLPAAGGVEGQGKWSDARVELPPEVIATLDEWNQLRLDNPGNDAFKVRRFWIELELPDKRDASSQITATCYTQPTEWKYAEGIGVPYGQSIRPAIRFAAGR